MVDAPSDEAERVGLCFQCVHARVVTSDRGAVFYRCLLSKTDPHYPPYPRLPVLRCAGYEEGNRGQGTGNSE